MYIIRNLIFIAFKYEYCPSYSFFEIVTSIIFSARLCFFNLSKITVIMVVTINKLVETNDLQKAHLSQSL